ncbi:MAG: hypothetical protein LBS83_03045, partial [Holosporales bacterium]|nr:hypothetical protein [Holosporales bacterium]
MFFRKVLLICSCLFFTSATQNSWGGNAQNIQNYPPQEIAALGLGGCCSWRDMAEMGILYGVTGCFKRYLYDLSYYIYDHTTLSRLGRREDVKNFLVGAILGSIQSVPEIIFGGYN